MDEKTWQDFIRRGQAAQKAMDQMAPRRKAKQSYDQMAYDVAEYFLMDEQPQMRTEDNKQRLAQHIQKEIENWIEHEREHPGEA